MIDDYAWDLSPKATEVLGHIRTYIGRPGDGSDARMGLMAATLLGLTEKFGSDNTLQIVADAVEWHFRESLPPPSDWVVRKAGSS